VAAELKRDLGLDAELRAGGSGEFTVWIDDKLVAEKKMGRFPSPEECVVAVKAAIPA
jgi:predicted Rdx family selenoprotein